MNLGELEIEPNRLMQFFFHYLVHESEKGRSYVNLNGYMVCQSSKAVLPIVRA